MSINKVILVGNCAEPKVKNLENNIKIVNVSIATTERFKDRNGEARENTEWHVVSVWGKTADFVENYVRKGDLLYVEGKIRSRSYKNKQGIDVTVTEILAETVQKLSSSEKRASRDDSYSSAPAAQRRPEPAPAPAPVEDLPGDTDGLPF